MIFKLLFGNGFLSFLEKLGRGYDQRRAANAISERDSHVPASNSDNVSRSQSAPEYTYPRVQRNSMGSLFEIYLAGTDRESLIAAANEALNEIDRLDSQLSHYKEDSDLARLNQHASEQWVRLEPRMYSLIKRCANLNRETDGAFDVTTSPLTQAWGFFKGDGRVPSDEELAEIMQRIGTQRILFDDDDHLVYYTAPGLQIDFGAIGKGYAIDEAANILRFYNVESALIHGGQSTIYALGTPQGDDDGRTTIDNRRWTMDERGRTIDDRRWTMESENSATVNDSHFATPLNVAQQSSIVHRPSSSAGWELTIKDPRDHETPIQKVFLRDESLSTSGNYEQFFEAGGVRYSHILDPRTGRPTQGMVSVSVIAANAADSDALSTAFFVMGREKTEEYCRGHPNIRVVMMEERADGELEITRIGF